MFEWFASDFFIFTTVTRHQWTHAHAHDCTRRHDFISIIVTLIDTNTLRYWFKMKFQILHFT